MKIYFDMCSLQRPLDDKMQLRIQVEAEAILGLLALCQTGQVEMVASEALVFEADANSNEMRRDFAVQAMVMASEFVKTDVQVIARARTFVDAGIKPLDALHLASAMASQADFLCTCDDRFLKKARALETSPTKPISPLELIAEMNP